MKALYLMGEPLLKPDIKKELVAPSGQWNLCQKILKEAQDEDKIISVLQKEYLAIAFSLKEMGIKFRVIYAHEKYVDKAVINALLEIDCKLVKFSSDFYPSVTAFPRDFGTFLPGIGLLNSHLVKVIREKKNNYFFFSSPYGEGGRVIACNNTMIASEAVIAKDHGPVKKVNQGILEKIKQNRIKVGLLPPFLSRDFSSNTVKKKVAVNDHQGLRDSEPASSLAGLILRQIWSYKECNVLPSNT